MPLLKTAMAMILPANVAFDSPDTLKADAAISFVALTQAEHALDFYMDQSDVLAEINRRLQPTEELQFRPIFYKHYAFIRLHPSICENVVGIAASPRLN